MGYNGNPSHVRIQSYHDYRHIFYIFIIILIPSDLTNLPSDLTDLPSDLTDLSSDLTDLPCHYCLHIQSIRRINHHYTELTFFLLPVMVHHHRYTVLLTFICNPHYAELPYSCCP